MEMKSRISDDDLSQGSYSFDEIQSLCQSFSANWAPDARFALDGYLDHVTPDAQPTLLRNLLYIDIELRRARGERPNAQEYADRYPQFGSLIWQVLFESSQMTNVAATKISPAEESTTRSPAARRLGDYRLLEEIGHGGMGKVYEAVHVQRGDHVALKTLSTMSGALLHHFKREFRAVADVHHSHLVGMHSLESDGNHWFLTMDLIDGVDFLSYVRPQGKLDSLRLRSALGQLVTAVLALHGQGIIHRDLKPSNVMVSRQGKVIVLDFGLVWEVEEMQTAERIVGTAAYMSPEQAAGKDPTVASDWYALGVMIYEACCGRRPFSGPSVKVIREKEAGDPRALPPSLDVPKDLAALAMKLLARSPADRPDPREIAKVISSPAESAGTSATLAETPLVGRTTQLAALASAYQTVQQNKETITVFISGRSGEGKTSLAEHFLAPLRKQSGETAVMSGRCYDRESVPFKALDSVIDALSNYLCSLPKQDAALLMPDDIGVLAQVFPVLQRVDVVPKAARVRSAELGQQQVRRRAFAALKRLLRRISLSRPIVWFIDDLQWGDADSAEALLEGLRPPNDPAMLLIGSYRSDEAPDSKFLRTWEELKQQNDIVLQRRDVKVGPLSSSQCTELVISLLETDNEAIRRQATQLAEETGGNPFLLIELLRCFDAQTGSYRATPLHEVIDNRLAQLGAGARRLLEVVAVSGQAISMDEASEAAQQQASTIAACTQMREERLLRWVGSEEDLLMDTYHDRIRETVLGNMEETVKRTTHLCLAQVIQRRIGPVADELADSLMNDRHRPHHDVPAIPRVYDLAYHFGAAGKTDQAIIYGLLAAEQARRQFAYEVAAQQYALADRNLNRLTGGVHVADDLRQLRSRTAEGYGETLLQLGKFIDGCRQLNRAHGFMDNEIAKTRIECLQGEIALYYSYSPPQLNHEGPDACSLSHLKRSQQTFEQILRRLGCWIPRSAGGYAMAFLQEAAVQTLHTIVPTRWYQRRTPLTEKQELAVRALHGLSYSLLFQSTIPFLWGQLAAINRGERKAPSPALALEYAFHSCAVSWIGWHSRGAKYHHRASAMFRQWNDNLGLATCFGARGMALFARGEYQQCLEMAEEALRLFDQGGFYLTCVGRYQEGVCHFMLGNLAKALEVARQSCRVHLQYGLILGPILDLWSAASRGDFPFDELRHCTHVVPDDVQSTSQTYRAEGRWHLFHGRTAEALQACEKGYQIVRKGLLINWMTVTSITLLATALRRHAQSVESRDPQQSDRLRRRSLRISRWSSRLMRFFPPEHAASLREYSLILAAKNRLRKAFKIAQKSCLVAEQQQAKYEHAQSLLVCGELAHRLGLPEAKDQIEKAKAELDEIESAVRNPSARRVDFAITMW